jgi:hypothetical protein
MAAASLAAPGTGFGPCVEACTHRDCAATRAIAAAVCNCCDGHIGYGVLYYEVWRSEDGKSRDYAHASCHEAAERRMT